MAHIEAGHGRLRKGQFMQQAYPDVHYKNEASARRQFNKVSSGETSGKKIEYRGRPSYMTTRKLGGYEEGLWKVTVDYDYEDIDGTEQHAARSFMLESMYYTRMEDVPYIYAILPPLVKRKIAEWQATGSYPQNAYNVQVTVEVAVRSNLPEARQISLDDVEIE